MAPAKGKTKAPTTKIFRGSIAWLSDLLSTYRVTVARLTAQGSLPAAGQALPDGLDTRRVPAKGFQLTSCSLSPFPKLLGTIPGTPSFCTVTCNGALIVTYLVLNNRLIQSHRNKNTRVSKMGCPVLTWAECA